MAEDYDVPPTNDDGPGLSLTLEDNDSTTSFIQKYYSKTYPENKMLVKNTTHSVQGYETRTLTSHTVESIVSGGALSRNPASPLMAYNRLTNSSLEGIVAFGSDWSSAKSKEGTEFAYPNASSTLRDTAGTDPSKRFLLGSSAFEAAVSSSMLGTRYAPGEFQSRAASYAETSRITSPVQSDTDPDGEYYSVSPDALTAGPNKNNYPAALVTDLSEEEKTIYQSKIDLLRTNRKLVPAGTDSSFGLTQAGTFGITAKNPATAVDQSYFFKDSTSQKPEENIQPARDLQKEFIDLNDPSQFFPSLSLLCLLVELTEGEDGIFISGNFGLNRASGGDITSESNARQTGNENGISDHAFGRGFDIFSVGERQGEMKQLNTSNMRDYETGLEILLSKMQNVPKFLQPDSVVISENLTKQIFGATGNDLESAVRARYPNFGRHIDFGGDSSGVHDNHVHISFGWVRAGNPAFLKPGSTAYFTGSSKVIERSSCNRRSKE